MANIYEAAKIQDAKTVDLEHVDQPKEVVGATGQVVLPAGSYLTIFPFTIEDFEDSLILSRLEHTLRSTLASKGSGDYAFEQLRYTAAAYDSETLKLYIHFEVHK